MSYKIIHDPHRCEKPTNAKRGLIIECEECGQQWKYQRILFEFGWARYPLPKRDEAKA